MTLGKVAGIKFKINLLFLVLCILYSYLGLMQEILIIIVSVLLHELGHTITGLMAGIKVTEIELYPFGGQATVEDFTGLVPEKEIYMSLGGPAISLSVAALSYYLHLEFVQTSFQFFVKFNILLGMFNLLPALPLDGGRVARAIIVKFIGYKDATRKTACMGKLIAIILFVISMYNMVVINSGFNLLVISVFLFWAACRETRLLSYSFMRYLLHKKNELSRNRYMPTLQLISHQDVLIKNILNTTRPTYYMLVVVVDDNCCSRHNH